MLYVTDMWMMCYRKERTVALGYIYVNVGERNWCVLERKEMMLYVTDMWMWEGGIDVL